MKLISTRYHHLCVLICMLFLSFTLGAQIDYSENNNDWPKSTPQAKDLPFDGGSEQYPRNYFRLPMALDPAFSGTFAEIRPNHFHSGLDFRTGGKIGQPIYAPADGYVSRINISPWGGGKVLYITHPNGYRTVYMHLNDFCGEIGAFVKKYQYDHHVFGFDTTLAPGAIVVKKNQVVAHSGNSGSSGGPHLHYEIRHAENDQPINPLYFGINYIDHYAPTINNIAIYPADATTLIEGSNSSHRLFSTVGKGKTVKTRWLDTLRVAGRFYCGIYAYDGSESGTNKNGVDRIELYVDDSLFYVYFNPSFLFEDTRSINAIIDYPEYQRSRQYYILTRHLRGNRNNYCRSLYGNGYLDFNDHGLHKLEYRVYDFKKNVSKRTFFIRDLGDENQLAPSVGVDLMGEPIAYYKRFLLVKEHFIVSMDEGTVYDNDLVVYQNRPSGLYLSPLHTLSLTKNPLPPHQAYTIKIRISESIPPTIPRNKVLIVNVAGNSRSALTTSVKGDWYEAHPRTFGSFALAVDTVPPVIRSLNFGNNKAFSGSKLQVKISDNLSGINSYHVFINGVWVLAELDGKTSTLTIDATGFLKKGTNEIKVQVSDAVGNHSDAVANIIH